MSGTTETGSTLFSSTLMRNCNLHKKKSRPILSTSVLTISGPSTSLWSMPPCFRILIQVINSKTKLSSTECPSRYLMQNSNRSKRQFSSIRTKKRLGFIIVGCSKGLSQRLYSCIELRKISIHWFSMREFATQVIWWSLRLILWLWQQINCQMFGFFILMEWESWFLHKKMNWLKHKLSKNTLSQEKTRA